MNARQRKVTGSLATVLAVSALIGLAASSCNEKKDVSNQSSVSTVMTNENGSVSRSFTEMTVTTNGSMVTEHRRETRTTLDADGNMLATTTSEYAQSYPVGSEGLESLSTAPAGAGRAEGEGEVANDSFMGLAFGAVLESKDFLADGSEPTLLRVAFTPKKPLAGFDDYFAYVTPKTHRVVKVYACAKAAVDPGASWRRHYLIEALEKRYATWARPRSWCRPIYTFDLGAGRYVTACLAGASSEYETVLVAWDDALLTAAADETEEVRAEARKAAAERRRLRVKDATDAF